MTRASFAKQHLKPTTIVIRAIALALVTFLGLSGPCVYGQTNFGRILPPERDIRVVAFGDFGDGSAEQRHVAQAIQKYHEAHKFDFGITLGDNFYRCGVGSKSDPVWKSRWEDLYGPLGIKFYTALGNHDYGHPAIGCIGVKTDTQAEVDYKSASWEMPARYYTFAAGPVRFFVLDTENWSPEQFAWLTKSLGDSSKEGGILWRAVYGHHPLVTCGRYRTDARVESLREALLPVFQRNKLDLYISGHDHNMQRLDLSGIAFVVAGGGGASERGYGIQSGCDVKFSAHVQGFVEIAATPQEFTVRFVDVDLKTLEEPVFKATR